MSSKNAINHSRSATLHATFKVQGKLLVNLLTPMCVFRPKCFGLNIKITQATTKKLRGGAGEPVRVMLACQTKFIKHSLPPPRAPPQSTDAGTNMSYGHLKRLHGVVHPSLSLECTL